MVALPPMPAPLVKLATKPAPTPPPPPPMGSVGIADGRLEAIVNAAVEGEVARVAGAANGSRNHALNDAAHALGTLVGSPWSGLARGDVEAMLTSAAHAVGLDAGETRATIKSGLDAGERKPRPEPDELRGEGEVIDWSHLRRATGREAPKPTAAPSELRLLTAAERKVDRARPREYVIEGQVRTGCIVSVNARPGGGKTALLVELAHRLSRGEPFLDRPTMACVVAYIAIEDEDDVAARLEARGADDVRLVVSEDKLLLTRPEAAVAMVRRVIDLARAIDADRPVVVMIDTLRAALGGKSVLDDKHTAPGLNALREVAEATGAVIAIANHTNRSSPRDTKGETLESVAALEYVLDGRGGEWVGLEIGKNRSGPGYRQIGRMTMTSTEVDGIAAAVIDRLEAVDARPVKGGDEPVTTRKPTLGMVKFTEAMNEALDTHGTVERVHGEPNAPQVRAVAVEHIRDVFDRIYPATDADPKKRADALRKAFARNAEKAVEAGGTCTGNWNGTAFYWHLTSGGSA